MYRGEIRAIYTSNDSGERRQLCRNISNAAIQSSFHGGGFGGNKWTDFAILSNIQGKEFLVKLVHFTDSCVMCTLSYRFKPCWLSSAFDGARRFNSTDTSLRPVEGNDDCFTELQSQGFISLGFMFHILRQLYWCDICCHVSGSFPAYVAGLRTSYLLAMVFVALKETPLINLIFQNR